MELEARFFGSVLARFWPDSRTTTRVFWGEVGGVPLLVETRDREYGMRSMKSENLDARLLDIACINGGVGRGSSREHKVFGDG